MKLGSAEPYKDDLLQENGFGNLGTAFVGLIYHVFYRRSDLS